MRKMATTVGATVLALGIIAVVSLSSVASPATQHISTAETLRFDVVFSPFFAVDEKPKGPSKGDESVFHDQLFTNGEEVGEDGGTCVIVDLPDSPSAPVPVNCAVSFQLPDGQITTQGLTSTAPTKLIAVTGGTGIYHHVEGQATLIEFGNGEGSVTFDLGA